MRKICQLEISFHCSQYKEDKSRIDCNKLEFLIKSNILVSFLSSAFFLVAVSVGHFKGNITSIQVHLFQKLKQA